MKDRFWCARRTEPGGEKYWLPSTFSFTRRDSWESLLDALHGKLNPDQFQKKRREAKREGYEVLKVRLVPVEGP